MKLRKEFKIWLIYALIVILLIGILNQTEEPEIENENGNYYNDACNISEHNCIKPNNNNN